MYTVKKYIIVQFIRSTYILYFVLFHNLTSKLGYRLYILDNFIEFIPKSSTPIQGTVQVFTGTFKPIFH